MARGWKLCAAGPALRIAPKCFLKVDIVRKKQSLPTFSQSSDFSPSLDFMGQSPPSSFAPGLVLAGGVFIFKRQTFAHMHFIKKVTAGHEF